MSRAIVIFGDQLTPEISSLAGADKSDTVIVMAELLDEASYVWHHKKKLALIFSAMRHFAGELRQLGWEVDYHTYQPEYPAQSFLAHLENRCPELGISEVVVTKPGEYRLLKQIDGWEEALGVPVDKREDNRFVCSLSEFERWASYRKSWRMEYFYRQMRRQTGLLMDGEQPAGGHWNYDASNRNAYDGKVQPPEPVRFSPDVTTRTVLKIIERDFNTHPGRLKPFDFAVTRDQAEAVAECFIDAVLPHFGYYQDAMLEGEPYLFHALISFYLNIGLLDPLSICRQAESAWQVGLVPIEAAEGFIRQILGWREYVRGVYWMTMPGYQDRNELEAHRQLPGFFWDGDCGMNCMRQVIRGTLDNAYAHHIQRLMVTGNFSLLAGIEPKEVCDWYLAVYADAFEWVEMPNTLGMALHADGGLMGSKPYAASGQYIRRMSNYCDHCQYDVKQSAEETACPFNALYWDFIRRHQSRYEKHPRMALMVRHYRNMKEGKRAALEERAGWLLDHLDTL